MGKGSGTCERSAIGGILDASTFTTPSGVADALSLHPLSGAFMQDPPIQWAGALQAAQALQDPIYQRALRRMPHSLILDMDDTLISNQILFEHSKKALVRIYQRLDTQQRRTSILQQEHERIDAQNVPEMGFTPERWFYSAEQAGAVFAGRALQPSEQQAIHKAAQVAMGVGSILPGAEDVLRTLHACNVRAVIKTKGSPVKQQEKLAAHRFDRFIDHIEIVDRKNQSTFQSLVDRHGLSDPVSIGDSATSDIIPALQSGYRAILIATAHSPSHDTTADTLDVPTVASFPEAVLHLAEQYRLDV